MGIKSSASSTLEEDTCHHITPHVEGGREELPGSPDMEHGEVLVAVGDIEVTGRGSILLHSHWTELGFQDWA